MRLTRVQANKGEMEGCKSEVSELANEWCANKRERVLATKTRRSTQMKCLKIMKRWWKMRIEEMKRRRMKRRRMKRRRMKRRRMKRRRMKEKIMKKKKLE